MSTEPFKVVTIGDTGVGKTSIINRITNEEFNPEHFSTIGASVVQWNYKTERGEVILNIWDTAGQERFRCIIPLYLRNVDACIIVTDLAQKNAIETLNVVYENLMKSTDKPVYTILAGNKVDLVPENFSTEKFVNWANSHDIEFLPTSAKTGENIEFLFKRIASNLNKDVQPNVKIVPNEKIETKSCCL